MGLQFGKYFICTLCMCICWLLVVSDCLRPWTVASQAPLSMEFSRQEYWSGLPFSSPGIYTL